MGYSDSVRRKKALAALALWRESDLTQKDFCIREGIARSTFQYWCRNYDPDYPSKFKKDEQSAEAPPRQERFIPIELSATVSTSHLGDFELIYTNGVRLRCPSSVSMDDLRKLIGLQTV